MRWKLVLLATVVLFFSNQVAFAAFETVVDYLKNPDTVTIASSPFVLAQEIITQDVILEEVELVVLSTSEQGVAYYLAITDTTTNTQGNIVPNMNAILFKSEEVITSKTTPLDSGINIFKPKLKTEISKTLFLVVVTDNASTTNQLSVQSHIKKDIPGQMLSANFESYDNWTIYNDFDLAFRAVFIPHPEQMPTGVEGWADQPSGLCRI